MNTVSRREFIRVASVASAATVVAACLPAAPVEQQPTAVPEAQPTTMPSEPTAPPAPTAEPVAPSRYSEAPTLAERVARGELPPVDERLPENPDVCPVTETTGRYGGMLRRGYTGVSDSLGPEKVAVTSLVWFNVDLSLRACLAESWEPNEDATEWTFRLRRGTRWSDGEPLTSAAFRWHWDHVLGNESLTPAPPANYASADGTLAELETPDDYTVVVRFGEPNPLFAYRPTQEQPFAPGHYLEQFHPDFQEQAVLQGLVSEEGFETWDQVFANRNQWSLNPERPTVNPWHAGNALGAELFLMERNPYFWQVDADGQQLPYMDRVQHRLFETPDVFNLWILNGEIDMQRRHVNIANYTLFKEGEQSGGYRVSLSPRGSHTGMQVNLTVKEPRLREFFQDRRVRLALSYAVDRHAMNDLVFDGLAVPRQYSPASHSPQYYPELSNAHIEYDPERANALLDEAGYVDRDGDGFRLYKDGSGETLSFIIEGMAASDDAEMATRYFADVGVKATYAYYERSLHTEHLRANAIEAAWRGGDRALLPIITPQIFVGVQIDRPWALAWSLWKVDPTDPNGEEPPEGHWIWDIWDLWERMSVEVDEERRNVLFREILDIWLEELPMICYLGESPAAVIVKNGLRNYVSGLPDDGLLKDEHLQNPQTYFWEA